MPSHAIPANAALYKVGASMTIAGGIAAVDAALLIERGALTTGFALPAILLLMMGSYGVFAGLLDFAKWRRAQRIPALLLTEEGIIDATGIVTGGLVRWHEISGVREVQVFGQRSLALDLHDTEGYLDQLPGWKRSLLTGNARQYGTPCIVAQSDLAVPLDQARMAIEYARQPQAVSTLQSLPAASTGHWWTAIPPEERRQTLVRSER